jgi:hypothetical protein
MGEPQWLIRRLELMSEMEEFVWMRFDWPWDGSTILRAGINVRDGEVYVDKI